MLAKLQPWGFVVALVGVLIMFSAFPITAYFNTEADPLAGFAIGWPIIWTGAGIGVAGGLFTMVVSIILLIRE